MAPGDTDVLETSEVLGGEQVEETVENTDIPEEELIEEPIPGEVEFDDNDDNDDETELLEEDMNDEGIDNIEDEIGTSLSGTDNGELSV